MPFQFGSSIGLDGSVSSAMERLADALAGEGFMIVQEQLNESSLGSVGELLSSYPASDLKATLPEPRRLFGIRCHAVVHEVLHRRVQAHLHFRWDDAHQGRAREVIHRLVGRRESSK